MSFRHKVTPPDPRIPRPTDFEEGRKLIYRIFRQNDWNERDIGVYLESKGTDAETLDGVNKILDAMTDSRMVLFQGSKDK
jgi:hypothetical protein